jgi:AcrR family transcriptional regulator
MEIHHRTELKVNKCRGRPRRAENKRVVQLLMDATETLLQEHSYGLLTERKIADAAGVHVKMIHYYFDTKDGLIFAVLSRYGDDVAKRLKDLEAIDLKSRSISRQIFKIMVDAFYSKPWIAKIGVAELAHSSSVKSFYTARYGDEGLGMLHLRKAFDRINERGIYDRKINSSRAALCMFSMIIGPVTLAPICWVVGEGLEELKADEWIDYVADMFDCRFLGMSSAASPEVLRLPIPESVIP